MINNELLNKVVSELTENNQIEHIRKISDINGLFQAYKITQNQEVLEECLNQTLDLILTFVETEKERNKHITINNELTELRDFIVKQGISNVAAEGYIRAVKRVIKNNGYETFEDLCLNIDHEILKYVDGQDRKYHNMHLSALRRVSQYIYEIKENNFFFMTYQLNETDHIKYSIFEIGDSEPIEILKEASLFLNEIKDQCIIKPTIYYSDKKTIVPESKIRVALNS